ncbi:Modular FeS cluster scaffolding protein NifU [Formivibrio citricus]|uniref:Nitrogen fixation protein NifU n=1 Tax=Formivibrio citricus TaxID=83765 RepID=A0A1I4Z0H9_9NEIS|nr:Fe-S cluster assembly protein NifU [Formivibrio citricus]SFN43400.1 Modular FeS cluster scaffolding protein NifU [Formivibrio citricus]
MWDYTEKVKDHFFNPRNAGELKEANAVGEIGSISCGDALRLQLKVDPNNDIILDARFQTFGCGSAIASSSALTEMIKGKTLDEALQVSNQDIADFLDGLPPEKMHCSVMGREALQAAIANYRGETFHDDHEEGELVCKCFAIDSKLIEDVVRANQLTTVEQVTHYTKAGGACATCHEKIENLITKVLAKVEAAPAPEAPAFVVRPQPSGKLARLKKIEAVIETIRPMLQNDHGDIELVDVDDMHIFVKLLGGCVGCQMEKMTLAGIEQKLRIELGEPIQLVPVSDWG